MVAYIKTNKPKKLQKVRRHLDLLGFELDLVTYHREPNTIEIFADMAQPNYDIWRYEKDEYMPTHIKLKIKDILGTATIDEVRELILYATR